MAYIGTSPSNGVRRRFVYEATASQTSFSGNDENGIALTYVDSLYLDVFQNGIKLKAGDDYTATTGTSVVLVQGASVNDVVEMVAFDVFSVNDSVSAKDGGSFAGNIGMGGTLAVTGNTTVGGTLGVTGVHTVGNNAIYTSQGGNVTQNLVSSLTTTYCSVDGADGSPATVISLNVASVTDLGVGGYQANFTNSTAASKNPVPAGDDNRGAGESENANTAKMTYQIRNPTNLAAVDASAHMALLGGLA